MTKPYVTKQAETQGPRAIKKAAVRAASKASLTGEYYTHIQTALSNDLISAFFRQFSQLLVNSAPRFPQIPNEFSRARDRIISGGDIGIFDKRQGFGRLYQGETFKNAQEMPIYFHIWEFKMRLNFFSGILCIQPKVTAL